MVNDAEDVAFVLYCDRPDWNDITPIHLDEGPNPIVSIAYSDTFKDVYGYFRAIVVANERSERAFELTTDAVQLNPANYTAWQYRRLLLEDLNKPLADELEFCRDTIENNPKNYQVWHHRQYVVSKLKDPSKELRFTEIILSNDPKNYHAWTHRQWVLTKYKLFDDEIEFVERLLDDDLFNNSAWNHRFFVIKNHLGFTPGICSNEIKYTLKSISKMPMNESSWNYLRGILNESEEGLCGNEDVIHYCERQYEDGDRNRFLLDFIIAMKQHKLEKGGVENRSAFVQDIVSMCKDLAENADVIRRSYWNFVALSVTSEYESN
ncbi:protein farnesyltransferase/geranylgeranyltransferase type-1 subunit alpha-like [Artemia franciscana]|uniref:Protein farnesyltransferase/geranylgeranyltransferase type-1 subunit alpha n=1 Tax=Artemia franciscana TaxID=6661 RepID=A0AA88II22_ARTSF|nr:hypothetical protein QYM36_003456 [Artemia franciscana]KAK2721187.1 hypothetical protein QYM36_003456 [Artemia franciscana]